MDKYILMKTLGEGTYGRVWKAMNKKDGKVVAVKMIKRKYYYYYSGKECVNLPEVKALLRLNNHPNIIKLKEVILEREILYLVFECCMEGDLRQVMGELGDRLLSESQVKKWCLQVLQGLCYMQKKGYFHRDLKPENLLVKGETVKIADWGFAREINSEPPPYTMNVMSLWYKAPEVLIPSGMYDFKVDMWSMGAIMAELFTFSPLFLGKSEGDQLMKICQIIGSPTMDSWPDGLLLADRMGYKFPEFRGMDLSLLMPTASNDAINLISSLCSWDPSKRPTAAEALQHPFFHSCYSIPRPCYREENEVGVRELTIPGPDHAPYNKECFFREPGGIPISSIRYNKDHLQAAARYLLQTLRI